MNNKDLNKKEAEYLKLLQIKQEDNELIEKWVTEYMKNIKDPLYATIMNVLTENNPNSIVEVYKNMGVAQISEDNREFLLKAMKKLELDKILKEEGREEGATDKALRVAEKMLKRGNSIEDIVEITELPIEKIIEIKNKMVK
ncbi:MAG: glycerol dehydrogenase-like iron-containing ADH family enzyme [Clostridium sp.]